MGAEASCNQPDPVKIVTREVKIRHVCLNKSSTGDLLIRLLSTEELEKEMALVNMDQCGNCLPFFQNDTKPPKPQPKPIDIHTLRYEDGCSCLHLASKSGCIDICRLLIEACMVDINIRNTPGLTPIHLACLHDHYDIVLYYISQRADMNVQDESGRTPLDYCISPEMRELVTRNTRVNGEKDVNEVLPDLNYGHFKWNKEANFSSQNPLRTHDNNQSQKKSSMNVAPMQSRKTHSSNNSLSTTRPNSDSTINMLNDDTPSQLPPQSTTTHPETSSSHHKNHQKNASLSPRSVTGHGRGYDLSSSSDESKEESFKQQHDFFSSPLESAIDHGGVDEIPTSDEEEEEEVEDIQRISVVLDLSTNKQTTANKTSYIQPSLPTQVTPTKMVTIGNGSVGNNPFYQSFRKEGLAEKLADTRRSGRVVTAKGGSLQRDI